jgi:hypothetical protein
LSLRFRRVSLHIRCSRPSARAATFEATPGACARTRVRPSANRRDPSQHR